MATRRRLEGAGRDKKAGGDWIVHAVNLGHGVGSQVGFAKRAERRPRAGRDAGPTFQGQEQDERQMLVA